MCKQVQINLNQVGIVQLSYCSAVERRENIEVLTTARLDGDELLRMKRRLLRTPRRPPVSRGGGERPELKMAAKP
jgi:hypothetical protein